MKRTAGSLPTGRVVLLRTLTVLVAAVILGRFFQVSILDHERALASAKNQYAVKQTLQAKRGTIYLRDLNGNENFAVALNSETYLVVADPFLVGDNFATAGYLAPVLSMEAAEIISKIADKRKRYVILKKKLTKEEGEKVLDLKLKGITLEKVPIRTYPENTLAAQTVGFVDSQGDGRYGIEGFFNEDLRGYDGSVAGEKDAKRRIISRGKIAKPKDGTDIVLTIDHTLQFVVESKLREALKKYEADSGSIIVMDTKTGAILAMANEPTFNLNTYNEISGEDQHLFLNQAVNGTWEPGSVFKGFTLAAGLQAALYEPDTKIELPCSARVDGFEIRNAEHKCYPNPSMYEVLGDSINIGTIWIADKLGNEKFAKILADFGFGNKVGIELSAEASGRILPVNHWRDVHRATFSFGQGLTVSPLQIVSAYAAIANGGQLMKPYLVAKRVESDGREMETSPKELRQVISEETAKKTTALLRYVVTNGHGKRAAVPGYEVAGKTGTAQVVGEDGKYSETDHIGSFAGFFPSNEPRFAMIVKLDKPKAVEFAESSAAPTFGEIAKWLLHYAKVPPTENIN